MGAVSSEIFITTILATLCSTVAAIIAVKFLEKHKRFAQQPLPATATGESEDD